MVKTVGLLASSKSIEPSPPKEGGYECICRRAAGGPALLASRERVHVSHWLPLLGIALARAILTAIIDRALIIAATRSI